MSVRVLENGVQETARFEPVDSLLAIPASPARVLVPVSNKQRAAFAIFNDSGVNVFIGGSTVTAAKGFTLPNGQSFGTNADSGSDWYITSVGGGINVRLLEVS